MKLQILAMTLVLGANLAHAGERSITYFKNPKRSVGKTAVLVWDIASKRCEQTYPSLKKIDFERCRKIDETLSRNLAEYEKLDQEKWTALTRSRRESTRLPFSDLEIHDGKKVMRIGILRTGAQFCDAEKKNCRPISNQPADQLGFNFLDALP